MYPEVERYKKGPHHLKVGPHHFFHQKSLAIPNESSTFEPREPAKPLYNA